MKIITLLTTLTLAACISAQAIDPAEPILPTIITIKPITRSLTLVTISPRPTLVTTRTPLPTKDCGPCPISTTLTVTPIYKRPPICPEYLCYPCNYSYLDREKREAEAVEKRQLPTTTVLAPCCCATLPPSTTTITKDPCPNPCACTITTTALPTNCLTVRPSVTRF
ncbi:hypothetical protein TWF788_007400 [Orbilia oligospora]|uniref:Uncharacterized protein n=1 Tax=Orbilia oligospora TaxID=2813651 RepID=A0A7C8PT76_ORBOL|nr:hypothetical protein TWF788_007400 [Orbilia oligospora]